MTPSEPQDLSSFSMLDLFRLEIENQTTLLTEGLLALEQDAAAEQQLEVLMRAAHSLKGAARLVDVDIAVRITHAMEECFVSAQKKQQSLSRQQTDVLLQGVDLLQRIAHPPQPTQPEWGGVLQNEAETFLRSLSQASDETAPSIALEVASQVASKAEPPAAISLPTSDAILASLESSKRAVRVTSENLNRLLGMAGESIVASRWIDAFATDLARLKQLYQTQTESQQRLREHLGELELDERTLDLLQEMRNQDVICREYLSEHLAELEVFDRRFLSLAGRLYHEVLDSRMRPFNDIAPKFRRLVRDVARALGKEAQLEIIGETTPVDRDILEKIEAPLGHLLRNAVDHGIEMPAQRRKAGKPAVGNVRLEIQHKAGMLLVQVTDDGCGIDPEAVRQMVMEKALTHAEVTQKLNDAELLEFLFLPGFTMKETVTDISGRGVGLDVVQTMVKEVSGSARITSQTGLSTCFQLQLPLTLSVVRTLLVEIGGEPYAFPLNRIGSTLKLSYGQIESVEGRQHFTLGDRQVGLVTAHQVLDIDEAPLLEGELSIVVLGDATHLFGVVVDSFLGERELAVRVLDPRLGKVQDISTAALTPDQAPVLIFDVDDLIRSIDNLVSGQRLIRVRQSSGAGMALERKRVLVVDDSLTVRELERKLISGKGYKVEVAVDGMDAWNAVRAGDYDLVITDVDMPRLDGIELVNLIKKDPRLYALPVMIVSYKDREEDRRRGLEAGADYYLTKSSFHDETLLQAVADLIGEAAS